MKKLFSLVISTVFVTTIGLQAQTIKRAEEVFKKWFEWQQIMPDKDITTMTTKLDDSFLTAFKQQYEKTAPLFTNITPLLKTITASHINENGYYLKSPLSNLLKENLAGLYNLLQNDVPGFVSFIQKSQLRSPEYIKSEESGEGSTACIEKYNALFKLLFANAHEKEQNEYLFTIANKFFEYCFNQESFPEFEKTLLTKTEYPIGRMLYSVAWFNLAGNGWKHWHEDSLKNLKEKADLGNQIVYIAGGSDIYQMLKAGIYNIKNIDPQLPSQPKYYTDDWAFILRGEGPTAGLGDQIVCTFDNNIITMVRTSFVPNGKTFKARIATGEILELPESTTTWSIFDQTGKKLGEYVLERRFCQQADFSVEPNKTMLLSFNELYFICLPNFLNGWQIEPSRFPENLSFIIKQLRKPVTKQMAVNIRIASLLNSTDFKFIALGTCIN